jgi:hypothetical protein
MVAENDKLADSGNHNIYSTHSKLRNLNFVLRGEIDYLPRVFCTILVTFPQGIGSLFKQPCNFYLSKTTTDFLSFVLRQATSDSKSAWRYRG